MKTPNVQAAPTALAGFMPTVAAAIAIALLERGEPMTMAELGDATERAQPKVAEGVAWLRENDFAGVETAPAAGPGRPPGIVRLRSDGRRRLMAEIDARAGALALLAELGG